MFYDKGVGYRATLLTTEIKEEGPFISEKFSFRDPSVPIYQQSATRFSRKRLDEVYAAALAKLRESFNTGVVEVAAIFTTPTATEQ